MSFRLFVYYCSVSGGWAALAGWVLGRLLTRAGTGVGQDVVQGTSLGFFVALALGMVDTLWNRPGYGVLSLAGRSGLVALAGGLGAATGSLVGGFFARWTNLSLSVILGWGLTGLLVGAGTAIFHFADSLWTPDRSGGGRRKVIHALLGGCSGGLLGGVLFETLRALLSRLLAFKPPEQLLSSGASGFVALGACIGLFVALAQVILRGAWLKVETGRWAGRELILSRDETTIGRAEQSDLGLFGDPSVEPLHARILYQGGRYVLRDAGTDRGTFVNGARAVGQHPLRSRDEIRIGESVLRFGERGRLNRK